jgi:hypothetical protein
LTEFVTTARQRAPISAWKPWVWADGTRSVWGSDPGEGRRDAAAVVVTVVVDEDIVVVDDATVADNVVATAERVVVLDAAPPHPASATMATSVPARE